MPSTPISFCPQLSQKVELSLKLQLLPIPHGFSKQVSIDAATVWTALDASSVGLSMVVLVTRTLAVAVKASDAPLGASLALNVASEIVTMRGPSTSMAPPLPELTRNS